MTLQSDSRYDLNSEIPDVIGLRAIQPDAAVVKVMSILNNRCVRVVIPGIVFLLGLAPNAAFRGTYMYMARLRTFLTVADAAYLKSRDKRHGRSVASQMSPEVPGRSRSREPTHYSQPSTSRRLSPASASVVVVTSESSTPAVVRPHRYGRRAASFPLDLLLPRFAAPELRTGPCQTRWVHEYDSPASPAALTLPSLWLNLYTLSSDGSAGPGDVSSHPICTSDVSTQSVDRDQELSGDDAPPSVHVDLVTPTSPPVPARVQQFIRNFSPATALVTLAVESSTPISQNRVRSDCTPGTVDGGPVFQVSPDTMGFFLRTGDAAVPALPLGTPAPSETASACPPRLGEPVALKFSGSDAPAMSVPVIPLPSGMMLMPVSCSAQTVLPPGLPSQPGHWSSAIPQTLTGKDRLMRTVLIWIWGIIPW